MNHRKSVNLTIAIFLLLIIFIPTMISAKVDNRSKIAHIPITHQEMDELHTKLLDEIATWMVGEDLILKSDFEQYTISRQVFQFDIDQTIQQFKDQSQETFLIFFQKSKNIEIPLVVSVDETHADIKNIKNLSHIKIDQLLEDLQQVAAYLQEIPIQITYEDEEHIEFELVAKNKTNILDLSKPVLNNAMKYIDDVLIKPKSTFSLLKTIELPKSIEQSTEELSFIASSIYELFLHTNIEIIERHQHQQLPAYAKPGVDAFVDNVSMKDLIVNNNEPIAYRINGEIKQNELHLRLTTIHQETTYTYTLENEQSIEPKTIYRYSKDLKIGEEKIIQDGQEGQTIEIYRQSFDKNNVLLDSEMISHDLYLPTPKIILTSSKQKKEDYDADLITDEVEDRQDNNEVEAMTNQDEVVDNTSQDPSTADNLNNEQSYIAKNPFLYLFTLGGLFEQNNDIDESDYMNEMNEALTEIKMRLKQMPDESIQKQVDQLAKQIEQLNEQYEDFLELLQDDELLEGDGQIDD